MSESNRPFGQQLSALLADKQITQRQLSQGTGIAESRLSYIVRCERAPTHEDVRVICALLEVDEQTRERLFLSAAWAHLLGPANVPQGAA